MAFFKISTSILNYVSKLGCCCCWLPGAEDLAVCTRKATEEAAQVGARPEWEGQRKEESEECSIPGDVVPTKLWPGQSL